MDSWLTCISPNIGRKFKACLAYFFLFLKYRCKKKNKQYVKIGSVQEVYSDFFER